MAKPRAIAIDHKRVKRRGERLRPIWWAGRAVVQKQRARLTESGLASLVATGLKSGPVLPGEPYASPGLTFSGVFVKQGPEMAEPATLAKQFGSVTKQSYVTRV